MALAGRGEVIERLLAAHEAWFDIDRDHRFAGRTFPGYAEFHSSPPRYVLVKRAKLWGGCQSRAPVLLGRLVSRLPSWTTWSAASPARGSPSCGAPDHMTTYLSLAIVADAVDDLAWERVRRTAYARTSRSAGGDGADLRLAVADLSRGRVTTNSQGKPLGKTLQANAFIDDGAAVCAAGCGGARDAARNTARRCPRWASA